MSKKKRLTGNDIYPYMRPNARYSPAEVRNMIDTSGGKIIEETTYRVLAVMVGILWNHFGELNKKDTRMKVLFDLYRKGLEHIDQPPSPEQLEAEAAFRLQTNYEVHR